MSNLDQAVRDAINANLSGIAAAQLKEFITEAEQLKTRFERMKEELAADKLTISTLQARVKEDDELKTRETALARGQEQLRQGELTLQLNAAKQVAEIAVAEKNMTLQVLGMFLKNPVVRTNVTETVGIPVEGCPPNQYSQNGTGGSVQQTVQTRHTDQTQE